MFYCSNGYNRFIFWDVIFFRVRGQSYDWLLHYQLWAESFPAWATTCSVSYSSIQIYRRSVSWPEAELKAIGKQETKPDLQPTQPTISDSQSNDRGDSNNPYKCFICKHNFHIWRNAKKFERLGERRLCIRGGLWTRTILHAAQCVSVCTLYSTYIIFTARCTLYMQAKYSLHTAWLYTA